MTATVDPSNPYYNYYSPSIAAALVVAALFVIGAVIQIWRIIATRQWFGLVILVAAGFEFVGLLARAYSTKHLDKKTPYEIQTILILLAPILFAASVYMFLGRLIRRSGRPELSFIRIGWVTPIFVTGDIFCFFVQAVGVVVLLQAKTQSKLNLAKGIILAGLGLQVFFFAIFALVAIVFHRRYNARGVAKLIDPTVNLTKRLWNIYLCSLLITVRNVYRLIEYATGTNAYLSRHEWPTYALDVVLMLVIMFVSNFWYFRKTKAAYDTPLMPMEDPGSHDWTEVPQQPWPPQQQQQWGNGLAPSYAYGHTPPYAQPPAPGRY
ncbi:hypothetical protein N7468_005550 [Penicillium chermesinum]|uniref:Uncharacterized protein n=1 Tax=Penicillium chermesinum TaxID=63820 RepID=A0A9W9NZ91_9EURO|nr:uncharacterized protein N7468_005550 [Penicillium chermesinum]KAJ5232594.1 hypothetical protein N7468_005550 [Penicillium chermesinum]KAJ6172251.1 hypothetical protein N7470_001318 [Penicillium chermesinum]